MVTEEEYINSFLDTIRSVYLTDWDGRPFSSQETTRTDVPCGVILELIEMYEDAMDKIEELKK